MYKPMRGRNGQLYYVFDEETLMRQIRGFGPYVQILAPEAAAEQMREYLRSLPY